MLWQSPLQFPHPVPIPIPFPFSICPLCGCTLCGFILSVLCLHHNYTSANMAQIQSDLNKLLKWLSLSASKCNCTFLNHKGYKTISLHFKFVLKIYNHVCDRLCLYVLQSYYTAIARFTQFCMMVQKIFFTLKHDETHIAHFRTMFLVRTTFYDLVWCVFPPPHGFYHNYSQQLCSG